jgi:hypothetical protein
VAQVAAVQLSQLDGTSSKGVTYLLQPCSAHNQQDHRSMLRQKNDSSTSGLDSKKDVRSTSGLDGKKDDRSTSGFDGKKNDRSTSGLDGKKNDQCLERASVCCYWEQ